MVMLNKKWKDDLRIITSGPNRTLLLKVLKSFAYYAWDGNFYTAYGS